jgi:uncharacterized repeat protein (TIGR02543 family)
MKKILLIVSLFTAAMFLVSCEEEPVETFVITFDSNGGSNIASVEVENGDVVSEPDAPERDGFIFEYWYGSNDATAFDFSSEITEDMTLTAKWEEMVTYTITFNTDGGTDVASETIYAGELFTEPEAPTKDGLLFKYWYVDDEETPFDFTADVTEDITLNAYYDLTIESQVNEDYEVLLDSFIVSKYELNFDQRGDVHRSNITWTSESDYISNSGIVLPVPDTETNLEGTVIGHFEIDGVTIDKEFTVPLYPVSDVVITNSRSLDFDNLTTEYDVEDGSIDLFFEEDGSIPYVNMESFFALLEGFIDPAADITFTTTETTLTAFYQYYDEDEDELYDLELVIDAEENTLTTNDPGFYWAYVYTTETNYGRHIEYIQDHPEAYFDEGENVVYDLDDYGMDIPVYDGQILLPYYIANQLFVGGSYYNVYYNYDGLFGIYSLPDETDREFTTIHNSSMSGKNMPGDLVVHTFNMLAFNLNNLYGLQEIMEVEDYYDLLYSMQDDLLTPEPDEFEYALVDLLLQELDEPHTSYGYWSYFINARRWEAPATNSLSVYGTRFVNWYYDGLVAVDDAIGAKWGTSTSGGWNVSVRPDYWSLNDQTVMLGLDGFVTSDIEEDTVYNDAILRSFFDVEEAVTFLPNVDITSKYWYYNNSTETEYLAEILIKDASSGDVDTYATALLNAGFEFFVSEDPGPGKGNGYYAKTVSLLDGSEIELMVQLAYNSQYDLLYVGIGDSIPDAPEDTWMFTPDIEALIDADSAVYMELMLEEIETVYPSVTDIILDITWNTGGNVGALYRVLGFITDDPFMVSSIDGDTGGASTYVVDIDGIPSYSHLNWTLLSSTTSFSAANSLATIFQENDLGTVIGVQTGGGASSITPILLPNGSAFTMSSNNISAYRTGAGTEADPYVYHSVEFGITPDIEIDTEDLYNEEVLLPLLGQNYVSIYNLM